MLPSPLEAGPAAAGCTSPDGDIAFEESMLGCFLNQCDRYENIPTTTAKMASQKSEVLNTYLFIAVSLLSEIQGGPEKFRDQRASAQTEASD
jgi:hypothetical protein